MNKIRVVQIGAEHDHAAVVFDSLKRNTDMFEIAGYVVPEDEPTLAYNHNIKVYQDYRKMTLEEALADNNIQGAVIETSEKNLTKYARIALKRGWPVHMDKPGGDIPEEFEKMIEEIKASGLAFSFGYMYRYNAAIVKAMEMINNGELGDILSVEAQMNCDHPLDKRNWLEQYKGGMMFFLGCHLVDLILRIQGEPEEIIPLNCCSHLGGATGEDYGFALFKYKTGYSFAKTTAIELGGFMRRQLVIVGSKGTIEINPIEYKVNDTANNQCTDFYFTGKELCAEKGWRARGEKVVYGPANRYDAMMRTWGEIVLGKRENCFDYDYELRLYKAVMKACGIEK